MNRIFSLNLKNKELGTAKGSPIFLGFTGFEIDEFPKNNFRPGRSADRADKILNSVFY